MRSTLYITTFIFTLFITASITAQDTFDDKRHQKGTNAKNRTLKKNKRTENGYGPKEV
ncbi:hypothetical protein ACU8V7_23380 [Zobellia nedashkovskayae]